MRILVAALALIANPALAQTVTVPPARPQAIDTSRFVTRDEIDARIDDRIDATVPADIVRQQDLAPFATTTAVNAQTTSIMLAMPQPSSTVPMNEAVGGNVGSSTAYMRANAQIPRASRAGVVTTDMTGNWSVTWSTPLAAAPAVLPVPVNAGTQPIVCNVATRTTTGATGRCWIARTLPAVLTLLTALISYDVFGASPSGITVQVLAIPVSQ